MSNLASSCEHMPVDLSRRPRRPMKIVMTPGPGNLEVRTRMRLSPIWKIRSQDHRRRSTLRSSLRGRVIDTPQRRSSRACRAAPVQ